MDDGRLGGADYRKALSVCQRMERAFPFCQVHGSSGTVATGVNGIWLALSQDLRNDFVRSAARSSITVGT